MWKFQLKITSNKKVIAKKPLTNLYEMNNSSQRLSVERVVHLFDLPFLQYLEGKHAFSSGRCDLLEQWNWDELWQGPVGASKPLVLQYIPMGQDTHVPVSNDKYSPTSQVLHVSTKRIRGLQHGSK